MRRAGFAQGPVVVFLLLATSFAAALPAPADALVGIVATMSPGRSGASAVWTGTHVFLFGGFGSPGSYLRDILRFDPEGAQFSLMPSQLPVNVSQTSAVWTGEHAYIFGGSLPDGGASDDIVRYTPATDTVTLMGASLPSSRVDTSAVWSGQYAYVFGRDGESGYEIVRYDPAADEVQVMGPKPQGIAATSAVWADGAAYVFGGGHDVLSDQVLKYDPGNDTATVVAHLPLAVAGTSAVLADGRAYVFGGQICYTPGCNTDAIQRFDPATGEAVELAARLPSVRIQTAAAWDGVAAHVFGGCCGNSNEAVQVDFDGGVAPSAPKALTATAGPGAGQISLAWQLPDDAGDMRLTGYRVYRAVAANAPYVFLAVARSTAYTDTGLPNNATRFYQVSAVNLAGEGPRSGVASARTFDFPGPPLALEAAPALAARFSGGGVGLGIALDWEAPASDGGTPITNYRVYHSTSATSPGALVATVGNVTEYTHPGGDPLRTNYYTVRAVNLVGEGPPSARVCGLTYPWALLPSGLPAVPRCA